MKESAENQFKQFEYFVRFPESDGPWFEDPKADAVQHVENEKQVKKLIKKKEPMLLMFYTPWCSACKTVKKEFHLFRKTPTQTLVVETYASLIINQENSI